MLIYLLGIFIFGAFVGSFLNLIADRIVKGQNILTGRSMCDGCKMPLGPANLVPVLSFLYQRGKCSNCKIKLSLTYPFSEILTGLAFAYAAHRSNFFFAFDNPQNVIVFFYLIITFSLYIIIFFADLKYKLIPDVIVYSAIAFVFTFVMVFKIYALFSLRSNLMADEIGQYMIEAGYFADQVKFTLRNTGFLLLSSTLLAGFFKFLIYITRGRGMGGGDVKLAFLIGLFNGFPQNVLAVFLGFIFGAIYSVALMLLGKKGMKDTIAFGPFLVLGSIVALIWGTQLLSWYLAINI